MRLVVNGAAQELDVTTVASLVELRGTDFVAVARNGTIVPRSRWRDVMLADDDVVEVLAPMQGG